MSRESRALRVMTVMAHPDDAEFLVGGTLFRLKELGWELEVLTLTAGDCGSMSASREETARVRFAEGQAAADLLGAGYACVGLLDAEVFANAENLRRVVDCMRRFNPDVVITHSPVDYSLDHEETSRLVRGATFVMALPNYDTRQSPAAKVGRAIPTLYYADASEGRGPLGERLYPHFYVDISTQLSSKREMLTRHVSQREWLRSYHGYDNYLDTMTDWAASSGRECGFNYAEGFRQHIGPAYPREPVLQNALSPAVRIREG